MIRVIPRSKHEDNETYTLMSGYQGTTLVKGHNIETEYCNLLENGQLVLKQGFNWNGPSGPAINTVNTMMPSALHDCLYKLMQEGWLPMECRKKADKTYREALKNWKVSRWRRWSHFKAVDWFGGLHMKAGKL